MLSPGGFRGRSSYEAARSYRRTLAERGGEPTAEEARRLGQIERHLARLDSIPQVAVTPIVLALTPHRPLGDLIDRERCVRFDLDGTGSSRELPWPRPDAGLSVRATGRVGSSLVSEGGVRLRDGRALPTYDWVVALPADRVAITRP